MKRFYIEIEGDIKKKRIETCEKWESLIKYKKFV